MRKPNIDKIDEKILEILAADSRMSYREIAKRVRLSAPAAMERIAKMREAGVIQGFTISVDRAALGLPVQALMRIATDTSRGAKLMATIAAAPEIEECHKVTGADSYVLKVSASSMAGLDDLVDRLSAAGVVNTSLILATPVPQRLPRAPKKSVMS
ncbi:MAG: AsnC family transcriptional regulator [Alphaproteobacteria bacterium]|nr:AsnC family transcriptional regulator [Alphaproteobacteria bacterium]